MLIIFFLIAQSSCQFVSYLSLRLRLPGRCREGDFDCGFGHCVPARKFHDGRADCMDGSDEWCLFGQLRCGAYCVELRDSLGCLFNSKCDGSSRQPRFCDHTKEKLCREPTAFPCKGYGECVTWNLLLNGKKECIDGSDEDPEYIRTLEGPLRCYFNRTQLPQPVAVKYSNKPVVSPPPPPITFPPPAPLPLFPLPPCSQCVPIAYPLPSKPFPQASFTTRSPTPFPTLVHAETPSVLVPQYPSTQTSVSPFPSTRPQPVQIQHITPAIHPVPSDVGEFFPTIVTDVLPAGLPTKIDFTVQAQIKTVLPKVSTTTEAPTTAGATKISTDGMAHIHVIDSERTSSTGRPETHVNLGTGEIITDQKIPPTATHPSTGQSWSTSFAVSPTPSSASQEHPLWPPPYGSTGQPDNGISAEEAFFPMAPPVSPVEPAMIYPVHPKISYTVQPIIPVPVTGAKFGKPDYNIYGPQGLIPIRPGIAVPSPAAPFYRETTPRNPFVSSERGQEGAGVQERPVENANLPTVKIGVVTPAPPEHFTTTTEAITTKLTSLPPVVSVSISTTKPSSAEESQGETKSTYASLTTTTDASCLSKLLDHVREKHPEPYCTCDVGMMEGPKGCKDADVTTFRVNMDSVCGDTGVYDEDKARIVLTEFSDIVPYNVCISSDTSDGIVANMDCLNCNLTYIQDLLQRRKKDVRDSMPPLSVEGLNDTICESSSFNACHNFAVCTVDPTGVRYNCHCKKGTEDKSNGKGRDCFGFPEEDDCIKFLDICLIVWLLFLFGFLLICPLLCYLCHRIHHYYRQNTIHPISLTVPKIHTKNNGIQTSDRSGAIMASVLVDALRHNAKGISAVTHTMAKKETKVDVENEYFRPLPVAPQITKVQKPEQLPVTITSPIPTPPKSSQPSVRGSPDSAATEVKPVSTSDKASVKSATPNVETPILEQLTPETKSHHILPGDATSVHSLPVPLSADSTKPRQKTSMEAFPTMPEMSTMSTPPMFHPPPTNTTVVTAEVHRDNVSAENGHDSRSVGVQPTIWETYRAVGLPAAAQERQDSSSSLDSLIGKKYSSEKVKTPKSKPRSATKITPIEETPPPSLLVPPLQLVIPAVETIETQKIEAQPIEETSKEPTTLTPDLRIPLAREAEEPLTPSTKKKSVGDKLADMLGVTLDDQNDMKALTNMAERKIDLPLTPGEKTEDVDTEVSLIHPELRKSTPVESVDLTIALAREESKIKLEAKAKEKKKEEPQKKVERKAKDVFVPKAVREKKALPAKKDVKAKYLSVPRRGDQGSSTEESEPEVTFVKRIEAMKQAGRKGQAFPPHRTRRYRKPERQLSSISEKSAEIASEAAIQEPSIRDYTVSAPNTTRSLSHWHAFVPKHHRFDAKGDETDVDIPSNIKRMPLVSSPEIPDVSLSRSQTRLNLIQKQEEAAAKEKLKRQTSKTSIISKSSMKEQPKSRGKPFLPDISKKPSTSKSTASEPRSHRPSLISRKIATRKTEMRSAQSASDLTVERQETFTRTGLISKREKIARSEEFLTGLPRWDSSPYKEGEKKESLPPIHHRSTFSLRSVHVSPRRQQKKFGSSLSLMTGRSGSSISLSPYFDPKEGHKPPKEELWWTAPSD